MENLKSRRSEISPDAFSALVQSAQHEVFRLEALDSYNVDWDKVMYPQYLAGLSEPKSIDPTWTTWFADVKRQADSGISLSRVHIVPEVLTSYLRYEIEWGYKLFNQPSGERVFLVLRDKDTPRELRDDFFVIDDDKVVYVNYNADNSWAGFEVEENRAVVRMLAGLKASLIERGIGLDDFLGLMRKASLPLSL